MHTLSRWPELIVRDRRMMLMAAIGAAALLAVVQIALYTANVHTRGPGTLAELLLNLLLDASLTLVVRLPRTVGALAVVVTTVLALGAGLTPEAVTPAAIPVVVSFLVTLLPWQQAFAFAAVLALPAIPIWSPSWGNLYMALSSTALPALVALYLRARYELVRSLRKRAELADSERRLLAERAETAERQRLAADLHDIVTHHVTEIVLHADALRVTTGDDDARAAAEQIRRVGTRTLTELRDLMRVVTTGARPLPAGRPDDDTDGDLAALAAADDAALNIEGDPGTVPAVVARAVYRVVQESLTNARKHAPGAPVTVTVVYPGDRADVEVRNTAPRQSADPALTGAGSGMGLTGLNRRVTLLGGTFSAGDDGKGGFTVTASIPAPAT
ncbi:sensor histidine kinase [Nonomuraea angiospora]|uniref:sensor histidine kinase n=1 Tax=Nonomuraea angiospora TaxID=46172 RepID=UPI0029A86047|nr:ATP-binding protein [Nonomuraea angiospora]MDX3100303.1 histidine kinase [Nonomuraea angiospora]